jgi:hypothetical protein
MGVGFSLVEDKALGDKLCSIDYLTEVGADAGAK